MSLSLSLQPYRLVKDLRTNYEISDPDSVLEGDLDGFILNFLSASLDKDQEKSWIDSVAVTLISVRADIGLEIFAAGCFAANVVGD